MKSRFTVHLASGTKNRTWDGEPTHVRAQLDIDLVRYLRPAKPTKVYQCAPPPATCGHGGAGPRVAPLADPADRQLPGSRAMSWMEIRMTRVMSTRKPVR